MLTHLHKPCWEFTPNTPLLPERSPTVQREHDRVIRNLRRTRKQGATLTLHEWLIILNRYGWSCAFCGGAHESMEHRIPISWGGGTTAANVLPCCLECNSLRGQVASALKTLAETRTNPLVSDLLIIHS